MKFKKKWKKIDYLLVLSQLSLLTVPLVLTACGQNGGNKNKGGGSTGGGSKLNDDSFKNSFENISAELKYQQRKNILDELNSQITSENYFVPSDIENFLGGFNTSWINPYDGSIFSQQFQKMVKAPVENQSDIIQEIFQGKNDTIYKTEEEAKNSYFNIGSGFYYNGIFFSDESSLKNYLKSQASSSNGDKFIVLQSNNNTLSQTLNMTKLMDSDEQELSKLINFVRNNSEIHISFMNKKTKRKEYFSENDDNLLQKIVDKLESNGVQFNYTKINNSGNLSQYYVDNHIEDKSNLFGPLFFTGSSDIKNFLNKNEWEKSETISPINKESRSWLASNFFEFIIPEIDFDNEDPLFKDHKDKMLFYFPYDTTSNEYDMENLILNETWINLVLKIENEKPFISSKIQELANVFKNSKRNSIFYKIPTFYFFMLDQMIENGASEDLIISLKTYFKMLGDKVNRHLNFLNDQIFKNSTFDLLAPKKGKSENNKFDFNEYFGIGKNDLNISSNISTYLDNLYDLYPNLTVLMSLIVLSEQFSSAAPGLQINFEMVKTSLERLSIDFDENNIKTNWKYITKLWNLLTTTSMNEAAIVLNLDDDVFTNLKEDSKEHNIISTLHNLFDIKWIRNKVNLKNVSQEIFSQINTFLTRGKIPSERDFLGNLKKYKKYLNLLKDSEEIHYSHIYILNNLITKMEALTGSEREKVEQSIDSFIKFIVSTNGARIIEGKVSGVEETEVAVRASFGLSLLASVSSSEIENKYNSHYIIGSSIDEIIDEAITSGASNSESSIRIPKTFDTLIDDHILGVQENSANSKNSEVKKMFNNFFKSPEIKKINLEDALTQSVGKKNNFSLKLGFDLGDWFNTKNKEISNVLDQDISKIKKQVDKNKTKLVVSETDSKNPKIVPLSNLEKKELKTTFISKFFDRVKSLADHVVLKSLKNETDSNPKINEISKKLQTKIKESAKGVDLSSLSFNSGDKKIASNLDQLTGNNLNSTIDNKLLKRRISSSTGSSVGQIHNIIDNIFKILEKQGINVSVENGVEEVLQNSNKHKVKNSKLNMNDWFDGKVKTISEKILSTNSQIWDDINVAKKGDAYNIVPKGSEAGLSDKFKNWFENGTRKLYDYEKEKLETTILSKVNNRLDKLGNRVYKSIEQNQNSGSFSIKNDEDLLRISKKIDSKISQSNSNISLPKKGPMIDAFLDRTPGSNFDSFHNSLKSYFDNMVRTLSDDDININIKQAVEETLSNKNNKKLANSSSLNLKNWFKDKKEAISNYFDKNPFFDKLRIKKDKDLKTYEIRHIDEGNLDSSFRNLSNEEKIKMKSSIISRIYKRVQKLGDEIHLSLSVNQKTPAKEWIKINPKIDDISSAINSDISFNKIDASLPKNSANISEVNNKKGDKKQNNSGDGKKYKFNSKNSLEMDQERKAKIAESYSNNITTFFLVNNIADAARSIGHVSTSIFKLVNLSNSSDNSLSSLKEIGNSSFDTTSQIVNTISSIMVSLQLNSNLMNLSSKLLKLNFTFLALSWAIDLAKFLFDAIIPEEKHFVYSFVTDNQTKYVWDGGYLKTNWYGTNVLEDRNLEQDAKLLKPFEIISPKNRDFIYFDGKKYSTTELDKLKKDQVKKFLSNKFYDSSFDVLDKEYIFKYGNSGTQFVSSYSLSDILETVYNQIMTDPENSPFVKTIFQQSDLGTTFNSQEERNAFAEREFKKAKKVFFSKLPKIDEHGYILGSEIKNKKFNVSFPSDLIVDSSSNELFSANESGDLFIIYNSDDLKFDANWNLSTSEMEKVKNELRKQFINSFWVDQQTIVKSLVNSSSKFSEQKNWIEIKLYFVQGDKFKKFISHSKLMEYNLRKIKKMF